MSAEDEDSNMESEYDEDEDDYSGFSDDSSNEEDSEDDDDGLEDDDKDGDDDGNEVSMSKEVPSQKATDIATNHEIVGTDGIGRVYVPAPSDEYDSDDDEEEAAMELMKSQSIGYDMKLVYQKWKKLQIGLKIILMFLRFLMTNLWLLF